MVRERGLSAFRPPLFDKKYPEEQAQRGEDQPVDYVSSVISRQGIERLHNKARVVPVGGHSDKESLDSALDKQRGDGVGEVYRDE